MPMWGPPTPPQQDTDVYIDQTLTFLYDMNVMTESQLPPIYIKKESKRIRLDPGALLDPRRSLKVHQRKEDSVYAPRSLFERPSPALVKMRRDLKLQKFRGIVRPPVPMPGIKMAISKPTVDPPIWHNWTIHEDMALLKVIQSFQGLSLNLMILSPGHTPNWDFVADYVNTVSVAYRSPKQCRHRYETVIMPREEGRQTFDSSSAARKKKNKSGSSLYKFSPPPPKLGRAMRTAQQYAQDNNCSFAQAMVQRFDSLIDLATKQRMAVNKATLSNPLLKNAKLAGVLSECGIDLEHPVLPVEVAARRAERISREKKNMTPEQQLAVAQRYQILKSGQLASQLQSSVQATVAQIITPTTTSIPTVATPPAQPLIVTQTAAAPATVMTTVVTAPTTPPAALRAQRIIASSIQTPTVVSVSGLSPAQLQAATQRLIVSSTPGQPKTIVGTTAVQGKLSQAQLQMMRQVTLKQQQLRLQAAGGLAAQAVKTATVTIAGGQTAVQVQFTQAQPRAQFIKQGTVTVGTKQGIGRPVTDAEMAHILKRQQQLQQQKALAAAAAAAASGGSQTSTIQTLPSQVFAQAIQAGTSGTQVATLAKAVSNPGANTQTVTVTIPVSGVTIGGTGAVKATLTPGGMKTTTAQQTIRQLQINQQILAQNKKLVNPKIAGIAQVAGKGGVATQLIVGSKPLSTAMTMQHFQQVIRSPLGVQQGPVVLAKGPPRVIPVNTGGQGPKQTIQVVTASSQGLTTAIRPQSSSTLAGALAGIKVQGSASSQAQQALLSQVSAALQGQAVGMRQGSPVRIQTGTGAPLVAVTVQSPQQQQHGMGTQQGASTGLDKIEQVSRFVKK